MGDDTNGRRYFKLFEDVLTDLGETNKLLAYLKMLKSMDYKTGKLPVPLRVIAHDFGISLGLTHRLLVRARADRGIPVNKNGTKNEQPSEETQGVEPPPVNTFGTKNERTINRSYKSKNIYTPKKPKTKTAKTTYGSPEFLRYWPHHPPTAGSKKGAWNKWEVYVVPHLKEKGELFVDDMIDAIEKQKAYKAHMDSIGEFCSSIPMFERWAKEERWENKPEIPKAGPSKQNPHAADEAWKEVHGSDT